MLASYLADFGTRWSHEYKILNFVRFSSRIWLKANFEHVRSLSMITLHQYGIRGHVLGWIRAFLGKESESVATFGVLPMVKSVNLPMVLLVPFLPMVTRKP